MHLEAIESGRLPGDILDDIPCKYVNGTLVCEVSNSNKVTYLYQSMLCLVHSFFFLNLECI
jgi:hypothetical protein